MKKEEDRITEDIVKHTLDLLICEKRFELGGFCASRLTVERVPGRLEKELMYSLHTLIPAENVKEETHTFNAEYPLDWKQAFKEQHFPTWLKKWYPVKYKEIKKVVKFTAYNIYPKFPAMYPERCKDAIQIITMNREETGCGKLKTEGERRNVI